MLVCFELSMPSVGSWNGQWTGASNFYAKVLNVKKDKAIKVLEKDSYYYNFGDGWSASVYVKHVDSKEAAKIRRKSNGFCNYDWMIDSIIDCQEIKC